MPTLGCTPAAGRRGLGTRSAQAAGARQPAPAGRNVAVTASAKIGKGQGDAPQRKSTQTQATGPAAVNAAVVVTAEQQQAAELLSRLVLEESWKRSVADGESPPAEGSPLDEAEGAVLDTFRLLEELTGLEAELQTSLDDLADFGMLTVRAARACPGLCMLKS